MKKLFILCFSVFFIKNTAVAQEKDRVKYSYVAFSLLRNDEKGVSLSKDAYLNFAFKKQFPIVSQDLLYPGLTLEMAKQAAASGLYNAVAEGLVTSINKMNREENFYYTNGINTYVNATNVRRPHARCHDRHRARARGRHRRAAGRFHRQARLRRRARRGG
jgi:hypothetical protein